MINHFFRKFFEPRYHLPGPYKRIYHYHIPKSGGTSLNFGFIGLSCDTNSVEEEYESLASTAGHRKKIGDKYYVGWSKKNIEDGRYFYGFSHKPAHQLSLPANTFTIAIFRDPLKRVLSLYHMYRYYQKNDIQHPIMQTDDPWVGKPLHEFVELAPDEIILNQLYYFSDKFDTTEASDFVSSRLDYYWATKHFVEGLSGLEERLDLSLSLRREKNFGYKENHDPDILHRLKQKLEPEYAFLKKIF